jgi:hypothetical protein
MTNAGTSNGKGLLGDVVPVTAGATALAAFITALGASGILATIEREWPIPIGLGIFFAIAAGAFGVAPILAKQLGREEWKSKLRLAAAGCFVVSLGFGGALVLAAAGLSSRPSVSASLTTSPLTFTASASVGGLKSGDRLVVYVEGLKDTVNGDTLVVTDQKLLYRAFVGPDASGNAKIDVALPVPSKGFTAIGLRAWSNSVGGECAQDYAAASSTGCIIVQLPPRKTTGSTRPRG